MIIDDEIVVGGCTDNGSEALELCNSLLPDEVNKGEFICIMGPSGSGKSILLNIIGSWTSRPAVR